MTAPFLCAVSVVGLAFLATQGAARSLDTFRSVGWETESRGGSCVLRSLQPPPRPPTLTEFLNRTEVPVPPSFIEVVHDGGDYEFRANMPAEDELQFRIWSAGGYTSMFRAPTGQDFILTPAISQIPSPYLAASGNPTKSVWTDDFVFDPTGRIFTAVARVDRRVGFEFLLQRAEAGFLYVFVPGEMDRETSWEVRLGSSFRDALADFIRCQEGTAG